MVLDLLQKTFDIIFPSSCLHCHEITEKKLLCQLCSERLELMDDDEIAKFSNKSEDVVISLQDTDVSKTFLYHLKKGRLPLAKLSASYMYLQLEKRKISKVDLIVPLPTSFGVKINEILSKEIRFYLKKPILNLFFPYKTPFGSLLLLKKSAMSHKSLLLVAETYDENYFQMVRKELVNKGFLNFSFLVLAV